MTESLRTRPIVDRENRLQRYLRHGYYEPLGEFRSYREICETIAPTEGRLVIGVDGPSTGGKTSISRELVRHFGRLDIPVGLLPVDHFLTERPVRTVFNVQLREGNADIRDYSLAGWDHEAYHELLEEGNRIIHLESGEPQTLLVPNAYNRLTGMRDHAEEVTFTPGGVIITEGTGIHSLHDELFDIKIRVDVKGAGTLLKRVVERERSKKDPTKRIPERVLLERYRTTDVPHTNLLRNESRGRADFVVDTTRMSAMRVYENHPVHKPSPRPQF